MQARLPKLLIIFSDYGYVIIYLALYIVLENFIFMKWVNVKAIWFGIIIFFIVKPHRIRCGSIFSLFVAVLVDNFQRTLSATEKNKKAATRTVFQVYTGREERHIDARLSGEKQLLVLFYSQPEEEDESGSEYRAQEEEDDEGSVK